MFKTQNDNWVRGICIGKGSFGTVNLAVDKSNGAIFAVKSVKQTSNPTRFSQALENEIRILKSLSSPYVVKYLGDDVTFDNSSSIVYRNLHMEYMTGGTVADVAKNQDDVTLRSYTKCIVSALSYIHGQNIVHCDVKGKNVLVGEIPGSAKLADFGSSIELDGGMVTGTRGSPLWMAPEVVRGEYQGPESDVWSLGCTVIEMVTGKPAWQDRGVDTLRQIGYSDDLPKLPAHFSDELRDFLSKCLKRNPSERWNCDQLLHHPFLSSSSEIKFTDKKLSPRCVLDWSELNFSDEETSEMETENYTNAYQRIGELAWGSEANWESEGWEVVRNAAEETTSPEYSDWVGDNESNEEAEAATVSGSGRTNQEFRDSSDDDSKFTTNYAEGTSACCSSRDMDHKCCFCVSSSLTKLLLFNLDGIRHIYYQYLFLFNFLFSILNQFLMLFQSFILILTYSVFIYLLFLIKGFLDIQYSGKTINNP